jgi:branched-chain amino acid transport system ATP-binding protein
MVILDISNIVKKFGGLVAISNVKISVLEGEIYGLIGTNGAGKTTLFNVVCGFLKPENGTVNYKKVDITGFSPERICKIGIGRCFQKVQPFRSMTPTENAKVARAYGRKADKNKQLTIDEILEIVDLRDQRNILTEHLTLADKKKVEIARALAGNPELMLFDEVASGLTGTEIHQRVGLMKRLSEMGITIIVVEHIMKFIKEICHRVGVLHAGELICEGSPEVVSEDKCVIDAYLGSSNNGSS